MIRSSMLSPLTSPAPPTLPPDWSSAAAPAGVDQPSFGWSTQDRADGGRAEHERPHAGATFERKGLDLQTGGRRPAPPAGAPLREGPAPQVVTVGFPARLFGERRLPPRLPPLDRIDADALSGG